jgi:hypothetical protein
MWFGRYRSPIIAALISIAGLATSLSFVLTVAGAPQHTSPASRLDPFALMLTAPQLPDQEGDVI